MRWRDMRRSSNVRDLRRSGRGGGSIFSPRGQRGGRTGGQLRLPRRSGGRRAGGGIGMLIIIAIVAMVFGINPLTLLTGGGMGDILAPTGGGTTQPFDTGTGSQPTDEAGEMAARVLGDTEDVWIRLFEERGLRYEPPTLTLFSGSTQSNCGFASAASGPFYCPPDQGIFIDLTFFEQLASRFGAPGDFARAYVIGHEVGHHIQNQLGILARVNEIRRRVSERDSNAISVRTELQADCLSGVWGYYAAQRGLLEPGDLEEALNAASQIGDDTLQRRSQGYVVPETFSHGTSDQRRRWFRMGFDSGDMDRCDSFAAERL